jgi:hypothetical protein
MRRRLIDGDDTSYGIGLGPLATPGRALALWARNLVPLTAFALVPAAAALLIESIALTLLADGGATDDDLRTAATSLAALTTFPLAYGATAATFLLLDARTRALDQSTHTVVFFGRGLRHFGRLFGVFFLMGLALMAPLVPAGVLWKLDLIAAAIPLALIAVGFDIWLVVRWSVAAPAAVLEGASFSVAFERSKRLVKGAWWKTFTVLLPVGLVTALVAWGLITTANGIAELTEAGTDETGSLSNFAVSVITSPPVDCALFTLYAALCDRARSVRQPDHE